MHFVWILNLFCNFVYQLCDCIKQKWFRWKTVFDIRYVKKHRNQQRTQECTRSWWMLCYWGCQLGYTILFVILRASLVCNSPGLCSLRHRSSLEMRRWPKPPPGVRVMLPPNRRLHQRHIDACRMKNGL